ncbi:MAG: hypothetical protein ACXVEF_31835, partial [Polyangiales bacterium]
MQIRAAVASAACVWMAACGGGAPVELVKDAAPSSDVTLEEDSGSFGGAADPDAAAGPEDASLVDSATASSPDPSAPDTGKSTDSGMSVADSGTKDSGKDWGSKDSGTKDTSVPDTSVVDTGVAVVDTGSSKPDTSAVDTSVADTSGTALVWRQANLTTFTSYPDPGSEECIKYSGCLYAGQFAALSSKMPESWVAANNIAAVHSKDFAAYKLKTLR